MLTVQGGPAIVEHSWTLIVFVFMLTTQCPVAFTTCFARRKLLLISYIPFMSLWSKKPQSTYMISYTCTYGITFSCQSCQIKGPIWMVTYIFSQRNRVYVMFSVGILSLLWEFHTWCVHRTIFNTQRTLLKKFHIVSIMFLSAHQIFFCTCRFPFIVTTNKEWFLQNITVSGMIGFSFKTEIGPLL